MKSTVYTKKEEIVNAITHGVGACLAIAALVVMVVFAALYGNVWHIVSFSIFGSMLVLLYLVSTLYHSITHERIKHLFRKFDHMAIFLLIAGTYTPYCLASLQGYLGWTIFGIVWFCAILGVIVKSFSVGKWEKLSTFLYISMGWLGILIIKPLFEVMDLQAFLFLLAGGAVYTMGTFFYLQQKIKYNHGIWHLFVLSGSAFHVFSVLSLL
ncbi:MAG: PAQR family membrane homeostasis protein TrhA [Cyclobacteriaceae bacterium]